MTIGLRNVHPLFAKAAEGTDDKLVGSVTMVGGYGIVSLELTDKDLLEKLAIRTEGKGFILNLEAAL